MNMAANKTYQGHPGVIYYMLLERDLAAFENVAG
jgi:hypothetical protein